MRVDDAAEIRDLADHRLLDRGYEAAGPVVNRMITRRVRRALRVGAAPLPSAAPRGDRNRAERQAALAERLTPGAWDADTVTALADHLRSDGNRPAEHLAQELIGRLFVADYRASASTWGAAALLDDFIRSWNPLKRIGWAFSNTLETAQQTLSDAVGEDLAGVHATGIAVHSLVESLRRLGADWRDPWRRAALSPETAAARALVAPEAVLREATAEGSTIGGSVRTGTLVVLSTRRAASRGLDPEIAFLGSSWSRCPADRLVPALLAEIWRRAVAAEGEGARQ